MWAELSGLTRASAALWWRFLPRLLLWFWLGYAVHALCVQSAAAFGADAKVTGNIFFGVALIATGGGTLLMLHALGPGLAEFRRRLARFRRTPPSSPGETGPVPAIPTDVAAWRGGLDTVAVTIGPFLAIYSVWGMVGDEVLGLFVTNAKNYGTGSVDKWSIDLTDTRFYVLTAAAVWAVRLVVLAAARLVRRRRPAGDQGGTGAWVAFAGIVLEGLWVFLAFVVVGILAGNLREWLAGRVVTQWLLAQWVRLTDLLPDLILFQIHLPDLVRSLVSWTWTTLLPAASHAVLLPLVWLALTATVFGWRDLRLRDLVGLPVLRWTTGPLGPGRPMAGLGRLVKVATGDLRTKYLPVASSLRMLLRGGPRFVGAYLVLATVLSTTQELVEALVRVSIGPVDVDRWSQTQPFAGLLVGTVFTPVLVALYGAAFDRCLAMVPEDAVRVREQRLGQLTPGSGPRPGPGEGIGTRG